MVSVCLPPDALLQYLPSFLGFFYLGRGVSLYGCSSKSQPLLLPLDEGYLLTTTLPDLQHGIAPLGPPEPMQPLLLGHGVAPLDRRPWLQSRGSFSRSLRLQISLSQILTLSLPTRLEFNLFVTESKGMTLEVMTQP